MRPFVLGAVLAVAIVAATTGDAHGACNPQTGAGTMGACVPKPLAGNVPLEFAPGRLGVDLSSYQGCPRLRGVAFAVFKAGEGTGWLDPTLRCHVKAAQAARIPWGVYWFQRPGDQAAEAYQFVHAVTRYGHPPLGWVVDSEVGVPTPQTCRFVAALRRMGSRNVAIYTSPELWPGGANCGALLWVADYASRPSMPSSWRSMVAWQSSDGIFGPQPHGLSGFASVDVDRSYGLLSIALRPARLAAETRLRATLRRLIARHRCRRTARARRPRACAVWFAQGDAVNRQIRALGGR